MSCHSRVAVALHLGNEQRWRLGSEDGPSAVFLTRFREHLKLLDARGDERHRVSLSSPPGGEPPLIGPDLVDFVDRLRRSDDDLVRVTLPVRTVDGPSYWVNLLFLSLAFARLVEEHGGALLHGGLAERDDHGVLLLAPGGGGKSTTSARLDGHDGWRSLSDDATLVVLDGPGRYVAHPWPTFSRLLPEGSGGSWCVEHGVELDGLYYLEKAELDRVAPIGPGEAVAALLESSRQVMRRTQIGVPARELRRQNLLRFDNLSALAGSVPCYQLELGLNGPFWTEIERSLGEMRRRGVA
jgi:hypothetical protein